MASTSSLFAALGVVDLDALNDLARWFDGRVGPMSAAETSGGQGRSGDQALRAGPRSVGGEA